MICEANQGLHATPGKESSHKSGSHQLGKENGPCRQVATGRYLDGPPHNHDGVVQGPLCLLHKLLGATAEDDGASLSFGAAGEEIVPTPGVKSHV